MKTFTWGIVIVAVIIIAYFAYDSQRNAAVQLPAAPSASSSSPELSQIIPGVPSVMYKDPLYSFSLYYPATSALKGSGFEGYLPLTGSPVVAVTLNPSLFEGTNLQEAGLYVGATTSPSIVSGCLQPSSAAAEEAAGTSTVTASGSALSEFDSNDAGAGNIYSRKSFRIVSDGACIEFVEVLHSLQLGNFPKDTVSAFDSARFSSILDSMLQTVAFSTSTPR